MYSPDSLLLHPKPRHEDTKWTAPNIYPACEIEEWSSKQIKILLTETSFPFLLATKTLHCMMPFSFGYRNLFTLVYDFSSYRSQLMFEDPDSYLVFFTSSPLSRSLYLTCACPTLVFSLLYLSTSTWTFLQSPGHKDNYLCVNLPNQSNQQACLHTWTRITWPPPPPHGHTSLHRGSPEMVSGPVHSYYLSLSAEVTLLVRIYPWIIDGHLKTVAILNTNFTKIILMLTAFFFSDFFPIISDPERCTLHSAQQWTRFIQTYSANVPHNHEIQELRVTALVCHDLRPLPPAFQQLIKLPYFPLRPGLRSRPRVLHWLHTAPCLPWDTQADINHLLLQAVHPTQTFPKCSVQSMFGDSLRLIFTFISLEFSTYPLLHKYLINVMCLTVELFAFSFIIILWPAKPTDYFSHSSYTYPHYTPLPVLRDLHIAPPDHGVLQLHPCGQVHRQQVGQWTQRDQFTTSVMPRIYGTINIIFYHFLFSQYV